MSHVLPSDTVNGGSFEPAEKMKEKLYRVHRSAHQ